MIVTTPDSPPQIPLAFAPDSSSADLRPPRQRLPYPSIQALWWANDGRCERCQRPMDHRLAQAAPDYPDATGLDRWALVCPWCYSGYAPLPWDTLMPTLAPALIDAVRTHLVNPEAVPDPGAWITQAFAANGILVPYRHWPDPVYSFYYPAQTLWHPGVGHWLLRPERDSTTSALSLRLLRWRFPQHPFPATPWSRPPARTRLRTHAVAAHTGPLTTAPEL